MSPIRAHIPEAVQTILPWVVAAGAILIASVLLSSFIDTLHLSIQRGEAMREALAQQDANRSVATTQIADARLRKPAAKP